MIRGYAPSYERERGKWYVWKGNSYPSVTTIIKGGVPKQALVGWAAKGVAKAAIESREIVAAMARKDVDEAIDWLSKAPYRDREKKSDIGSEVHDAAEKYALGLPLPPLTEAADLRMVSFYAFIEDFKPKFIAVEAPVISRKERYAGTLDAIIELEETGIILTDYKSGKGVYQEAALQLAAYRHADSFIGLPSGEEWPIPEVKHGAVLHLREDGYSLIPIRCDEEIFKCFLYAREVYRWARDIAPGVIGVPIRPGAPSWSLPEG